MIRLSHLLIALLFVAGCGGASDSDPGDPPTDALSDFGAEVPPTEDPDAAQVIDDFGAEAPPTEDPDAEQVLDDFGADAPPTEDLDVGPLPCPTWGAATIAGALENPDLFELSGLVASRAQPGVLWAHNDSGDGPTLYALDATGADLGVVELEGASAADWEDLGLGPCPDGTDGDCLYVGDIGDNARTRSKITIYVIPEPSIGPDRAVAEVILTVHLTYPDGSRDSEALLVDPETGDLYVFEKTTEGASTVYRAAAPHANEAAIEMEDLGDIEMSIITAADISSDGALVLVRNYFAVVAFQRPGGMDLADAFGEAPCDAPLGMAIQGEAIAFTGEENDYLTIAEGLEATVHHYASE